VTPAFSICPKHGYLAGEHAFCPKCDEAILARKRAATTEIQPQSEGEIA
jgi:ribonucleoside-triphosphate reductase